MSLAKADTFLEYFVTRALMPAFNAVGAGDGLTAELLPALEAYQAEPPLGSVVARLMPVRPKAPPPISTSDPNWGDKENKELLDGFDKFFGIRRSFLDSKDVGKPATLGDTGFGSSDATLKKEKARERFAQGSGDVRAGDPNAATGVAWSNSEHHPSRSDGGRLFF